MAQEGITLDLKEQHDQLLASKPDDVTHDAVTCPFCSEGSLEISEEITAIEGGDMSKTYTEDELAAAVAEAVRPVSEELASFKASQDAEEVEARIAEAVGAVEAAKAEVEGQLDVVTAERDAAKTEFDALVELLEEAKRAEEVAAEMAAKRDERVAQVKEVASFTDEYIAERAEKWTAMDDEAFETLVEAIKATKDAKEVKPSGSTTIPASTAMTATRDDNTSVSVKDTRAAVMSMNRRGIDPRTL